MIARKKELGVALQQQIVKGPTDQQTPFAAVVHAVATMGTKELEGPES